VVTDGGRQKKQHIDKKKHIGNVTLNDATGFAALSVEQLSERPPAIKQRETAEIAALHTRERATHDLRQHPFRLAGHRMSVQLAVSGRR
jgi:hypothetical protein